ncbi:DNA repair protein RadA (plasmid) [Variovorax sp. SRS16]|uniref:DNA repair protein RadA n=1 Tax=Variovorax sp. SRS16 TaxID=282217 RepID=UPI001316BD0A|nr:DNA repair protein RadA [Variovorax sp. SRS16]VTU41750.1 DNA repair protein RadA [Variovorax sp. SRS16]
MVKKKSSYACNACGQKAVVWGGKCSGCNAWNTMEEVVEREEPANSHRYSNWSGTKATLVDLRNAKTVTHVRWDTGLTEFNRVLGGGLVKGSVVLVGGDPGIGKSTLLMQVVGHLSPRAKTLYVSGEESPDQLRMRTERLGLGEASIQVFPETELEEILAMMDEQRPDIMVVDSIQTVFSSQLTSAPGNVAQVKECAAQLNKKAKSMGIALFLVGHVTKEGNLAGPRVLEHIVDAVLYFEGESGSAFRMVRAFKNRFGSVNELGVFAMGEKGLEEVSNPSSLFLTAHEHPVPGTCILAALEGNRPFLVEVQALVEDAPTPNPKRFAAGVDTNRLQMLLAVLNKHASVVAFDQNVYVKIVGGVRLTEPAADLPLMLAAHSSLVDRPLPKGMVAFGEVGLAGEIRPVTDALTRLKEAAKLGFTQAMVPLACKHNNLASVKGIDVTYVSRVDQAIGLLRELKAAA